MGVTTNATWRPGSMAFDVELQGHRFVVDATEEFGGKDLGPRPKALVLSALAGCTAMDVVYILQRMRVPFTGLTVDVAGELGEQEPKVFAKLHLTYRVSGENVDRAKVEKAVEMSQTTYCGVTAMLRPTASITYEIVCGP